MSKEIEYDLDKMDYYIKQKILLAFLELLHEHNTGIYSLDEEPINLSHGIISEIPEAVVKEYEGIRSDYELRLKQLIKKIEALPSNPI
ncbi:hypothetical protein ACVRXF_10390 [Streptococcus orisasini]